MTTQPNPERRRAEEIVARFVREYDGAVMRGCSEDQSVSIEELTDAIAALSQPRASAGEKHDRIVAEIRAELSMPHAADWPPAYITLRRDDVECLLDSLPAPPGATPSSESALSSPRQESHP